MCIEIYNILIYIYNYKQIINKDKGEIIMIRKEVKQKLRNFRHVYFIHYDGEGRKKIIYKKIIGLYRYIYIYKYDYSNGTSYHYHREGAWHQEEEFDKNDNRTYYC